MACRLIVCVVCVFIFSSCGGGSNASDDNGGVDGIAPLVDAGEDMTVDEQTIITLSASAEDADSGIATVTWQQLSDIEIMMTSENTLRPSIQLPDIDRDVTIRLQLSASDEAGNTATDTVNIFVTDIPVVSNQAPIANAGDDREVVTGTRVQLSAENSSDADGEIVSFRWSLNDELYAETAEAVFVPDQAGRFDFVLTVTDDQGADHSDMLTIVVTLSPGVVVLDEFFPSLLAAADAQQSFVDDRVCEDLVVKATNYDAAVLSNAVYVEEKEQKRQQLLAEEEKRDQLKSELMTLQMDITTLTASLDEANEVLELLEQARDEARAVYDTCRETNPPEACQAEYEDYRTKRDAVRTQEREVIDPLEEQLAEKNGDKTSTERELASVEEEIRTLNEYLDRAEEAQQAMLASRRDYVTTFSPIGGSLDARVSSADAMPAIIDEVALIGVRPYTLPAETPERGIAPIGVLGVASTPPSIYGGVAMPGVDDIDGGNLLPWSELPTNQYITFIDALENELPLSLQLDTRLSCNIRNAELENSLATTRFFLAYVFAEPFAIQNTYSLSVDVQALAAHVQSYANELGFIHYTRVDELFADPVEGLVVSVLNNLHADEVGDVTQKLKVNTIKRFLDAYAIPASRISAEEACANNSFSCATEGWWLRLADAPYTDATFVVPADFQEQNYSAVVYLSRHLYSELTIQ